MAEPPRRCFRHLGVEPLPPVPDSEDDGPRLRVELRGELYGQNMLAAVVKILEWIEEDEAAGLQPPQS